MKKHLPYVLFSITLIILVPLSGSAQEINFNKVKLPKGIKYIGNVAQDKYGYLWLATDGLGLVRFDGYEFKPYLNEPGNLNSLAENHLEKIYIDKKGLIWIATWTKGLDRFDPITGVFTHFRHIPANPASLSHDLVRAMCEDQNGKLWIGTHGGLDLFDPQKENFKHYRHVSNDSNSLSCDRVRTLFEDKEGILWVGTGSTWDETNEISKDEGGLNRFDRKTGKFKRYLYNPANKQSLINNKVQSIFEDSKGVFWVGTAGDGLHTLDRKTDLFQRYPFDPSQPRRLSRPRENSSSLYTDYITFINEDAAGRIWIGTFGNGLAIYDRKSGECVPYKLGNELESEPLSAMLMSKDSILWISVWSGSLYNVNPFYKSIPRFDLKTTVFSIAGGASNVLWLGTASGLVQKNLATGITKTYTNDPQNSNSILSSNVWSICEDKSGILWIGTDVGLGRFDPKSANFRIL
jgi:ligand-binding sensor domain-containing protein